MKTLILILSMALSLYAVQWRDYQSALKEQKITKKPIMLDIVRTGCHYCTDMDKKVFDDKDMSKWIEERFIPVKINKSHETLPLGLKVMFTPTFYFVDEKGKILKRVPGSWDIQDFKDLTEKIK